MKTFWLGFLGALAACVIALGAFCIFGLNNQTATTSSSSGSEAVTTESGTTLGATTSTGITVDNENQTLSEAVAEKCLPSVAAIDVYTKQSTSSGYSMFGYGQNSSQDDSSTLTESSLGSGVVLSADGYIITNYHVIEGADALKVTVEGSEYDADVVGTDESSDIAVIKVRNVSDLTPVEIGDSDSLVIGEWVMSIGSPFGLEQSVATGIVSATSRSQILNNSDSSYYGSGSSSSVTIYPNMIQTDAAINPGNSGGALVDSNGKLIGINTLITSYSGNYSGVGFAIPVNYAINIAQQIIDGKTPTHAQLGVTLSSVTEQSAQRYGLSVTSGAYVASVTSGSGAANAGLQVGDIITKVNDKAIESASDLMLAIRSYNPGDTVNVTYNRSGQESTVAVTLGDDSASATTSSSQGSSSSSSSGSSIYDYLFGNQGQQQGSQS